MKSILKSIGYLLFFFCVMIGVQMAFAASALGAGAETEAEIETFFINNALLMTIISNLLAVCVLSICLKLRKKSIVTAYKRKDLRATLIAAVTAFTYSMCFSLVSASLQLDGAVQNAQSLQHFNSKTAGLGVILMIGALLVSTPLAEEFVCRGIIIKTLKERFSPLAAILISSCLFGVMHLMAGGPVLAVGAIIMGIIFGVVYEHTGSLLSVMFIHACANMPDFLVPHIPNNVTVIIGAVCLLVCIISLFPFYVNTKAVWKN